MLEPTEVEVNGRTYTVNPMNPEDVFNFYHDWANAVSYGKSLAPLGMKAIRQCIDSEGRSLAHAVNFQKCFSEHPEDMRDLELKARDAILLPFERPEEGTE